MLFLKLPRRGLTGDVLVNLDSIESIAPDNAEEGTSFISLKSGEEWRVPLSFDLLELALSAAVEVSVGTIIFDPRSLAH